MNHYKNIKNDENLFFIILDFLFAGFWRIMHYDSSAASGERSFREAGFPPFLFPFRKLRLCKKPW